MSHSLTLGGESIDVILACSMNGSLMMFTTKVLVALMFRAESLRPPGVFVKETEMIGGEWVTCGASQGRSQE